MGVNEQKGEHQVSGEGGSWGHSLDEVIQDRGRKGRLVQF